MSVLLKASFDQVKYTINKIHAINYGAQNDPILTTYDAHYRFTTGSNKCKLKYTQAYCPGFIKYVK